MYIFITLTYAISSLHLLLALTSIIVGIISQSRSLVWMAHSISPIWSGIFFAFCGGTGIACARQKGLYLILCYVALSIITLIVDCVNIQLLRLGVVNIMTDGQAYLKDRTDILVLIALTVSSIECILCLLSLTLGIRLSYDAANRKFRKREGAFFVQVLSEKEIVVVSKAPSSKQSGSRHESVQSFDRASS
ncbi:unnamed protein product [Rotaria magnacalcarata]|uniref:Transmembrane protein 196 n=1 Tax=Rotaria magnacalcarata TaxID=392030 RepID=A0A819V2P0_9BILA|nr:unnamed protein product [Rotaria magnacalcarata]CAF1580933.1 unnamed protein product [Rotaria magnacalcarata]CAF1979520.1 unnamed protein product [Rotaria magnacalcarata]CAF2104795.1 unnamed protein product [Rotaria magnacalcarata]CAF2135713.1 unnamed protein product [Rotaria magnacalcarata]